MMTPEMGRETPKIRDVKGDISSTEGAFSAVPHLLRLGAAVTHGPEVGAGGLVPGLAWGLPRVSRARVPPVTIRLISRCACDLQRGTEEMTRY